ncbi:MAG: flagellar motor protein MotB [Planctomycetaceae bacterium]|nr:flagellar motor protein MotB [Planctomycetaceae bacterium]MCA9042787.1 flagellar motor protein MotB [Planctomycetaceae bacterium]MCB9952605.1 flagellar motor protein MotB [Planctomycetaceae bacterium]
MAREKKVQASSAGEVPAWFMTYSDVITLLMTFFILLLTFASNEPEKFERMQISMFGGGGSQGFARESKDAMDRESVVTRYRPRVSRMTQRGVESPPEMDEYPSGALDEGLRALQQRNDLAQFQRLTIDVTISEWLDDSGELTGLGSYQLQNLLKQLAALPIELELSVATEDELKSAMQIAQLMTHVGKVQLGRISVSIQSRVPSGKIRVIVNRELLKANNS